MKELLEEKEYYLDRISDINERKDSRIEELENEVDTLQKKVADLTDQRDYENKCKLEYVRKVEVLGGLLDTYKKRLNND